MSDILLDTFVVVSTVLLWGLALIGLWLAVCIAAYLLRRGIPK